MNFKLIIGDTCIRCVAKGQGIFGFCGAVTNAPSAQKAGLSCVGGRGKGGGRLYGMGEGTVSLCSYANIDKPCGWKIGRASDKLSDVSISYYFLHGSGQRH